MKGKFTRVTLLLILVAMVATTLVLPLSAFAAGTATGYKSAGDVVYNTNGKYIYNWGARGERATFLSKYAVQFYTGNYTFANLSKVSGGTSDSNAPSSGLYKQLQELMKSKHTYTNSYSENNNLLQYTDCENGGGTISSFYSGKAIGPSWGAGGWNKEHTWPNSKGLGGADEDDVMMIRPTATSENSSRGNLAYGESSGYYNPNNESNGKYDLRGDCARIFLYMYTRWGNTNGNGSYSTWGTRGVMESVSVLLKWMEQDPVDTWEMGRNDAVQAITGTRNVFVDYPEYAWLLFGEAVPENYATPSGSNGVTPPDPDNCKHKFTDATCTEPKTCTLCWTTQGEALGHTEPNAEGLCDRCGKILDSKTTHAGTQDDPYSVADALKIGATLNGGRTEKVFVQGEITNVGTVKSSTYRQGMIIKDSSGQTLTINTANPKSSSDLDVKVGDTILLEGYIRSTGGTIDMGSKDYTTYTYYSIVTGGQTHTHSFGQATCTKPATCSCGATQGTALGHTTTNGTCTRCGIVVGGQGGQTSQASKSIDLTSVSNKVSASANLLAFASGELKVSINKASATSDLKDYTESGYSARVYFGATLTVEYPQMTKIVINCDDYTSGGKVYYEGFDGMEVAGATITRDNLTITIEFANPVDTFTSGSVTSQTRIKSIEVFTAGGTTPPAHTCESKCPTCGGCTDASCTESACTTKCQGHQTTPPVVTPDETVNAFKSAVASIQSATTMQQKFDTIKVAANAYNSLNDTQKAQVTTEFEQLKTAIADYNASATTQNTNSINVLYWTAQVSLIVTMAVALVLLKKVF